MYCLVSETDYPDRICIVSDNPANLEEIALSLFEEDWYEWFCIINDDNRGLDPICSAFIHALEESDMYNIVESVFIGD